jgi:serine protease Do
MKLLHIIKMPVIAAVLCVSSGFAAEVRVPKSDLEIKLSYAPIVKSAGPAVVNIYTKRVVKNQNRWSNDPFFRRFFGAAPRERVERSLGSGVIVRENGIIVTNEHVIAGADEITVILSDRREYAAKVLMHDERTDLAILKLEAKGKKFPILEFDDSDALEVGDLVLAIGNPFGVGQTVTSGIVSAVSRTKVGTSDYQSFIQTDASVNPGNSGGALIDMRGRLVGINSAIFSRSGGSNGIGFAIPSNMVRFVLESALSDGKLVRPWFGASGQAVTQDIAESLGLSRPVGVMVDEVYPSGPADKAGLQPGDVLLRIDGREVFDPEALRFHIALKKVGGRVKVTVFREEKTRVLYLPLKEAAEKPARNITEISGNSIFRDLKIANLSPAFNDELGLNMFEEGVIIMDLQHSPLRRFGIRNGDVFDEINGKKIKFVKDLRRAIMTIENDVKFTLYRGTRRLNCAVRGRRFGCR